MPHKCMCAAGVDVDSAWPLARDGGRSAQEAPQHAASRVVPGVTFVQQVAHSAWRLQKALGAHPNLEMHKVTL